MGEFASDVTDTKQALFVKSLKNTSNNPQQGNWDLMMKNVYYLASQVEKEKFRLDVKYQSDTTGVYLTYIPRAAGEGPADHQGAGCRPSGQQQQGPQQWLLRLRRGLHRHPTDACSFPKVEPFGSYMLDYLVRARAWLPTRLTKYAFTELYDSTKTVAKQIAEKNKYQIVGQFKGSAANVISLGAYNVPQGSVVVTAGGVTLTEGTDYSVDYSAGEVTILNQSIIDAGTAVNVSLESNTDYGQTRKTMFGLNWEYDFSKNFQMSGTLQHLSEQALTTKVSMGSEPLKNTLWGINLNWKQGESVAYQCARQDTVPAPHPAIPDILHRRVCPAHCRTGRRHAGQRLLYRRLRGHQDHHRRDRLLPPGLSPVCRRSTSKDDYSDKTGLTSGFHRARLAWYTIDPLFTRRGSSLTPGHIKSDLKQLSNHYVREVYVQGALPIAPARAPISGATNTLSVLNLAYYPIERGPYNFNVTDLQADGTLANPQRNWGGMMRKLDTNDFEQANMEYIEFWMLDPFIYSREEADAADYGGDFYINLGEVSEDILRDGKKFYESGMPVDGQQELHLLPSGVRFLLRAP